MTSDAEPEGPRRRLLAVDDNRLILRVVQDYFELQGWQVTTAESVSIARSALGGFTPDVIVSDILMPEIDGWTFFEDVRKRKDTASVPFVFLTSQRELPQRLRGLHLGADEYMTKPFAVEELHARIERILERSAALKQAHRGGSDALLAGSVEHLAISDLLQILALNAKDGTVRLQRPDREGRIEFAAGRIVDAQAGTVRGTKALFRMLGWTDATFRVMAREEALPEETITAATSNVLMEGLVSLDEWSRWGGMLPAPQTKLVLAEDAQRLVQGRALKPVERDLLVRSRSGVLVGRALEDAPFPDAQIAEAICTLLARGVFRAVQEKTEAETGTRR